jgi:signal transduction histidine kinase/DNA-binding response OmpR family regulator
VTANRLVLLAAVPLLLALAVVAFITIKFAANERDAQAWVRHTYQVMEAERRVQTDVETAEAGVRGYLVSHDQAFLGNYRRLVTETPADLKSFRALTTDNSAQQARAARLENLVRRRFQGLDAAIRFAGPAIGNPAPVVDQALTEAREQMNQVRAEVNAGLAEEQKLLAQHDADRLQEERLAILFALGAAILVMGILLIAAALLVRNNIRLAAAERSRANEAAILQATLDTIRDGIAYFSSDGLLCVFNSGFFQLLGLPQSLAKARQTTLSQLRAEGRPEAILSPPQNTQPTAIETRHLVWAGRELDVYKARVATGGFLIGIADVTARLKAEATARQAQKMEAIGHLTGGVAHDFNNLLQIIGANLDLAVASDEARGNPRLGQRLQNAMGAVSRGARLTGQLLAFARRQTLNPRSVDLGRVLRDMSDLLHRTLGETVRVETVIAGGLWNTLVDPTQVENAILNLAINGRDAMPDGGKLTLEVANAYLDDAYADQHPEINPGQYVMLAVSDTGTGMNQEVLNRAFEPFFSTKPEGKGTGLGLAQAYGFAKQSGGHVKIYSEPGEGTTVKLYLPRTRRAQDHPDHPVHAAVEGGNEHILVVEDDDGVRAAVVDMLTELGYRVSRAENAEAALRLLENGAEMDLLFTDVVMPGALSAREFTRKARELHPELPVLYTSGYAHDAIVHNGRLDDDVFLLSKPYRKDELARKLRALFAAGPRKPPAASPEAAAASPAETTARSGKVLVVEDVALIRMATVDMIEQLGFPAVEAGDGPEALALLRRDPEIAILFTDLGLPGMDGRQLVAEARRLKPDLKVIVASGYSSEAGAGDRLEEKNVVRLVKPYDLKQIRRALSA